MGTLQQNKTHSRSQTSSPLHESHYVLLHCYPHEETYQTDERGNFREGQSIALRTPHLIECTEINESVPHYTLPSLSLSLSHSIPVFVGALSSYAAPTTKAGRTMHETDINSGLAEFIVPDTHHNSHCIHTLPGFFHPRLFCVIYDH